MGSRYGSFTGLPNNSPVSKRSTLYWPIPNPSGLVWLQIYAENEARSRKPEIFVCVGICTHLGCSPTSHFETGGGGGMGANWQGGFLCPCHGSTFDLAGRVYKNKPAPDNLEVPPYQYLSDTRIIVGVDEDNKA